LLVIAIPAAIFFVLALYYVYETPRFALIKDRGEGVAVLKVMHKRNHDKELEITQEEIDELEKWAHDDHNVVSKTPMLEIFKGRNLRVTLTLSFLWFAASFIMVGLPYILVMQMNQNQTGIDFGALIFIFCAELPGHFIAYYLIENPTIGRKKLLVLSSLTASVFFFLAFAFPNLENIFAFICRMSSMMAMDTNFAYSAELYHTNYRANAMGYLGSLARAGCIAVPLILVAVMVVHGYQIGYLLLGIAALVFSILGFTIPYETGGKPLDIDYEEEAGFF